MAVEQLPGACWYPHGDDFEGDAHYPTEARAREAERNLREGDPLIEVTVLPFPAPCWTVTCDGGCEVDLEDGEYEWTLHLESRTEAEQVAGSYDWTVTADSRAFCDSCGAPEGAVIATRPIPGHLPRADRRGRH